MTKILIKKILYRVPLLLGITFISFMVIHLAPGKPSATGQELNPGVDATAQAKLETLYGLDQPLLLQYGRWLLRLGQMDFGQSFVDGQNVISKIADALPITLLLSVTSLAVVFIMGVPLGLCGALNAGKRLDKGLSLFASAGIAMPGFWLALILLSLFGVHWRWFPVSGLHSLFYEDRAMGWQTLDFARHLVLPVLVTSLAGLCALSRYARSSLMHELKQDYIRTARAKGLAESRVLFHHALKNALLPMITILGLSIPGLLGGSVVVETVFSIPGMGRLFFSSVFTRDYPVIMGILVLGAIMTLIGNALADVLYGAADPRINLKKIT